MKSSKPKAELIQVRVAHDEKRRLVAAAQQRGISLSDLIRSAASDAARAGQGMA